MIGPLAMLGRTFVRRAATLPRRAWLLAVLAFAAGPLAAQQPVPRLTGRVVDLTATLSSAERAALEQKLAALEQRKGSQIAVLIARTTAPEAIEQYSLRVAEAWQIGRGKTDDGIVVVVAKDDRKARIEVGYGLEGAVPDALAKRIVADRMAPRFAAGDFAGGLNDGVDALIALIDRERLPPPNAAPQRTSDRGDGNGSGGPQSFIGLLFILALFVAPLLRRMLGALFGGLAVGGIAAAVVWALSGVFLLALGVGFVAFMLTLAGVVGGPGRWSSGGGYWGGRGGFGGGLGGGGGFSGGGGRFGGGGASGGW
jgi:uncharacterized protein